MWHAEGRSIRLWFHFKVFEFMMILFIPCANTESGWCCGTERIWPFQCKTLKFFCFSVHIYRKLTVSCNIHSLGQIYTPDSAVYSLQSQQQGNIHPWLSNILSVVAMAGSILLSHRCICHIWRYAAPLICPHTIVYTQPFKPHVLNSGRHLEIPIYCWLITYSQAVW